MIYGLYVLGGSFGVLLALTLLYRAEQKHQTRLLLTGVRNALDRVVVWVQSFFAQVFTKLGAGAVRASLHYIVHHVLEGIIALLKRLQRRLFRAYERSKWQHSNVRDDVEPEGHLHEIAKHKGETALTEAEKRKLRKH